jgi:hypothetical protein
MSLWGNVDASNNAPNFSGLTGYDTSTTDESLANSQPSSVFGNTYISATRTDVEFGVFGIDTTEGALVTDGHPTHAGWVARTKGAGGIASVTANAGAAGPSATAASYTLTLTGGGVNNTSGQVVVTTNAAGWVTGVSLTNAGLYTGTPSANTFGNTALTFTMGGRNGRTTFETLVAMGSMVGDASDDAIAPDS